MLTTDTSPTLRAPVGRFAVGLATVFALTGCADGGELEPVAASAPAILALSTYSAPLGTPVEIHGQDFPSDVDDNGNLPFAEAVFDGIFLGHDGTSTRVQATEELDRNPEDRLVLASLGPFEHPFSDRQVVGTFEGTMTLRFYAVESDNTPGEFITETTPEPIEFTIEPSIFITRFAPLDADCAAPVPVALAGLPYEIEAVAVGFEAEAFRFSLNAAFPEFDDGTSAPVATGTHVDVQAIDNQGRAGSSGGLRTPTLPEAPAADAQAASYALVVSAEAREVGGRVHQTSFGLFAYAPIVTYTVGQPELAQLYQPTPIGQCQEGAASVTRVTYQETTSETVARTESRQYTDTFGQQLAAGQSVSLGATRSASSSYQLTSTTGIEAGVELSTQVEVGAEGSVPGFAKVSVKVTAGIKTSLKVSRSESRSATRSATFGVSRTSTDSRTYTRSQSSANTTGTSGTQTSSVLNSFSISADIFPNTAAVWYRQRARYEQRAVVVRYTLCGEEQVIGTTTFPDYRWSVELASGPSCFDFPQPSDLQPAQCFSSPCDN